MKNMILILFLLIFKGCATQASENQNVVGNIPPANVQNLSPAKSVDTDVVKKNLAETTQNDYDIANSLGFVSTSEKADEKDNFIRIYNQDGSIWYEFTFYNDDSNNVFKFENENFRPFRYDTDDLTVVLKCVGEDSRYYHVIVNEETRLKKFVRKNDPVLKFGTWEQYVLDCFAVGFDNKQNPLHKEPNGEVIAEDVPTNSTFHTEEIKGEWLKIKWYDNDNKKQSPKFGWVKWKNNNKIILYLFETA